MILGGAMAKRANVADPTGFIMFPLVVHALDCVVSAAGIMSVAADVGALGHPAGKREDPYEVLKGDTPSRSVYPSSGSRRRRDSCWRCPTRRGRGGTFSVAA